MSVTKTTRFQVLKRDDHTCQYCGGAAPDVKLTVDHVIPAALGGSDKPSNLVAACVDCNAGKGAANPDNDLVERLSAEAATYALEMANKAASIVERLRNEDYSIREFDRVWENWTFADQVAPRPHDYRESVRRWHRQNVPTELIEYAVEVAMTATKVKLPDVFRYMAGVIYRTLDQTDVAYTLGDSPVRLYTSKEKLEAFQRGKAIGRALAEQVDTSQPVQELVDRMRTSGSMDDPTFRFNHADMFTIYREGLLNGAELKGYVEATEAEQAVHA